MDNWYKVEAFAEETAPGTIRVNVEIWASHLQHYILNLVEGTMRSVREWPVRPTAINGVVINGLR